MHAYVSSEDFRGLSVDQALRQLLYAFRLPGEAQKIDRIIEKFAERYCANNPGAFPTADAPYLLAFAIIMLNTDAHNPMAESRISAEDFVTMCVYQTEGGDYDQILPREDVMELFKAVVGAEIEVRPTPSTVLQAASINNAVNAAAAPPKGARLAAAMGLGQLAAPFWSGASWDKQHGVDIERQRLLELTGQLLASASAASASASASGGRARSGGGGPGPGPSTATLGVWHSATHAEHARPMMQVCGAAVSAALSASLARGRSLVETTSVLDGFDQAIRLAALLRLEALCETLVASLAAAARLVSPPPPQSSEEARQVAVVARLIALGSCSEAGALGSAWVVILRALSELESLKASLTPGSSGTTTSSTTTTTLSSSTAFYQQSPTSSSTTSTARPTTSPINPTTTSTSTSLFGRLFSSSSSSRGGGSGTGSGAANNTDSSRPSMTVVSERSGRRGPLAVRTGPGMGVVLWAETAGAAPIDRIFTSSVHVDGDAVLTFFRALAAVSQEELDPGIPGAPPRVYLLHRFVECAGANTNRIRLVWQRLWTVISQHLVSAACHTEPYVAMFAVDALRQLADKLLTRGEVAGFSAQGDALRPFVAVLRSADRPSVRELVTACVAHVVGTHARRMGGGWKTVIEALGVAAADPSPAVVAQSLDTMSIVFAALYNDPKTDIGGGHACLRECMRAALAAVGNPAPAVGDLTPAALYMVQTLARRLAEDGTPDRLVSTSGSSSTTTASPPQNNNKNEMNEGVVEAWVSIIGPLAAVARTDPRPKAADTAASVLFQTLTAHVNEIVVEAWPVLFDVAIAPLLSLSGLVATAINGGDEEEGSNGSGQQQQLQYQQQQSSTTARRVLTPTRSPALSRLHLPLPMPSPEHLSPEGRIRVLRHASAHLPELWGLMASASSSAVPMALLAPSLALLRDYAETPDEGAAGIGTKQLHLLLQHVGPRLPPSQVPSPLPSPLGGDAVVAEVAAGGGGWSTVEGVLGGMMALAPETWMQRGGAPALLRRSRSSLLAMRCVGELVQGTAAMMPAGVQVRLLGALQQVVETASSINKDPDRRLALANAFESQNYYYSYSSGGKSGGGSASAGEKENTSPVAGFAAAVRAEAGTWDQPTLPAYLRHEVEGGRVLMAALKRGATEPAALEGNGGGDGMTLEELKRECERRLVELALGIVRAASALVVASPSLAGVTIGAGAGAASTMSTTSTSASTRTFLRDTPTPAVAEEAVRAALVRDALLALSTLPPSSWRDARHDVLRYAAKLVCSRELAVRKAVQAFMRSQGSFVSSSSSFA